MKRIQTITFHADGFDNLTESLMDWLNEHQDTDIISIVPLVWGGKTKSLLVVYYFAKETKTESFA